MNKKTLGLVAFMLWIFASILSACNAPSQPVALPPTENAGPTLTASGSQVTEAPSSETPTETHVAPPATSVPSSPTSQTPVLSPTPEGISSPTITNTTAPTLKSTPTCKWTCGLISMSPRPKQTFKPGEDFDLNVRFQNTGTETWKSADYEFHFLNGVEMQKFGSVFNLSKDVKAQETVDLVVDMVAPQEIGNFTAVWALVRGKEVVCATLVDINVSE